MIVTLIAINNNDNNRLFVHSAIWVFFYNQCDINHIYNNNDGDKDNM